MKTKALILIAFIFGIAFPAAAQQPNPADLATMQVQARVALQRANEALNLINASHPDASACRAALAAAATSCGVAVPCLQNAVNACRPAAARFPNYGPKLRQLEGEISTINARLAANEAAAARAQATADQAMAEAKKAQTSNCYTLPPGPAFEACVEREGKELNARDKADERKWQYREKGVDAARQAIVGPTDENGKGKGARLPDTFLKRDVTFSNKINADGSEEMNITVENPTPPNVFYETNVPPPDDDSVAGLFIGGVSGGAVGAAGGCGLGLLIKPGEDTAEFYEDSGCVPGALIGGVVGAIGGAFAGYAIGKPDAPQQLTFAPTRNGLFAFGTF